VPRPPSEPPALKPNDPSWWTPRPDLVHQWRCEREGAWLAAQDLVQIAPGRTVAWFATGGLRNPTLADIAVHAEPWEPGLLDGDEVAVCHRVISDGQWQHLRR
jgi:hypothetical protein